MFPSIYGAVSQGGGGPFLSVTIDNGGGAALSDFPVRIELTAANFDFEAAQADGSDIRVKGTDNSTLLDWWIEAWDATAETGTVWANVPTVPADDEIVIYLYWGDDGAAGTQDPDSVFTFFDHFEGGAERHHFIGSDTGDSSVFVPTLRRIYFFGQDKASGQGVSLVQWLNIDTWEAGFAYPGLDTPVNGAAVVYNPDDELIYIYGGNLVSSGVKQTAIQTFNPATNEFDTLAEELPVARAFFDGAYDPVSGNIFLIGGARVIIYHDPAAGTVTTTSADLPFNLSSVGVVYSPYDERIYLFGGVGSGAGNVDTILEYDPANPNTNPSDTGQTLDEPTENQHGAYVDGVIYTFGGFRRTTTTYKDIIQKYDVINNVSSVVSATMPRADDDARAFYDPVTDRVYITPWLHSDQETANQYHEKVVVHVFNPNDETVADEPVLRTGPPAGWTLIGTSPRPPYHVGTYMVFDDDLTTVFIRAAATGLAISDGVYMFEYRVSTMQSEGVISFQPVQTGTVIGQVRYNGGASSGNWLVGDSSELVIAPIGADWQILGHLIDADNDLQYGLVNRSSMTASKAFQNALTGNIDRIWIDVGTPTLDKLAVDWVIVRKAAVNEPTVTVDA